MNEEAFSIISQINGAILRLEKVCRRLLPIDRPLFVHVLMKVKYLLLMTDVFKNCELTIWQGK